MVIGLDFDNVLMDFYSGILEYHNKKFNSYFSRDKAITTRLEELWGCSTEEMDKRIVDFYKTDLHDNTGPMPGSVDALRKLKDSNKLVVITSRPDFIKESTLAWLDKHFPGYFDEVCFTNLYLGKTNIKTKAQACKDLNVDVFVDDFVSYATNAAENGIKTFLLDSPWNQTDNLHANITRVRDWGHIVELLS